MAVKPCDKMLTSKKEIQLFLGNCSNHLFKKYVRAGMPARYEDGRWCASTTKIEQWWEVYTSVSMINVIDQIADDEDERP